MDNIIPRSKWSGKWAFILAGAASAVGLGNMWRFPYLAAKFGGGMFLLTYIVLVFTFGISLLLLENALGRLTGKSAVEAFRSFGKKFFIVGLLTALIPFIITPYYCLIGGWVTKYMAMYLAGAVDTLAADGGAYFTTFILGDTDTYAWMLVFMAAVFVIVAMGIKDGIEKANKILMPALILMALGLAIYVISQPGAMEGLAYYVVPDFSKFSGELVINALGQMFYSLSLAMGIMITYGSYLDKKEDLCHSTATIAGFDLGVSFIAGLLIVPAAFVAMGGDVFTKAGPTLMFKTLPQVFEGMGGAAAVVGFVFFALVLFAALTSAISLTETCVSIFQDSFRWNRRKSMLSAFGIIIILGIFVNLGYNGMLWFDPMNMLFGTPYQNNQILDFFDFISNSVLMPIVACATCIIIGWVMTPKEIVEEIKHSSKFKFEKPWVFVIKFVAPVLVIVILVWNIIGTLF